MTQEIHVVFPMSEMSNYYLAHPELWKVFPNIQSFCVWLGCHFMLKKVSLKAILEKRKAQLKELNNHRCYKGLENMGRQKHGN